MNIVDLLTTVIITILVFLALGGVTYLAYRAHRARTPPAETVGADDGWYFVRYVPEGRSEGET